VSVHCVKDKTVELVLMMRFPVVLGADTPLGQSLCHHLSAQGFIVLASVSDEDSMQVFDSLVPPSSRGYIKSIVLSPTASHADEVNNFVQSAASAKELRWPLTSAGDPYSRPGTEVKITALINALSYKSTVDKSLLSSMHIDQLIGDMTMRVSTPLATIKALLPLLSSGHGSSCTFVISIIAPDSEVTSQALAAGMRKLQQEVAKEEKGRTRILLTTLEAQTSSLQTRLLSLLPSRIGGAAPIIQQEIKTPSSSPLSSSRINDTKGQPIESSSSRPRSSPRTASSSDLRLQRNTEIKPILQAVAGIVLMPLSTASLRARYTVRLPDVVSSTVTSSAQAHDNRTFERGMLLGAIQVSSIPFVILASALGHLNPSCWLHSLNRSGTSYPGRRPAYGPGPGPASNTHSRSCIRPSNDISRSAKRPRSANSAASSDAAKSSGPPSTTATASGPPSNNGMSSSGLLSSVPSSAFGDNSEEEHFDFEEGNESPIQGSGPWASPVASEHDSDTALGARTEQHTDMESTPSGSRANIEVGSQLQYGFPSQASMEESSESWIGSPPTASESSVKRGSTAVPSTPLGQSWVAVESDSR
jgi:NAD(P)-dependent dehydrogenase (short-subunit alcohol dehydrogenase family)